MFQWDLAQIRRIKGRIIPAFLPDDRGGYASSVISVVSSFAGKTRREVDRAIRELELKVQFHKTLRAMYQVFLRKCSFVPPSTLDPHEIREAVFLRTGRAVTDQKKRMQLLEDIAGIKGTEPAEIEGAILGDLEAEQVLDSVPSLYPEDLVREYNFELFETVLLRCTSMSFSSETGMRGILAAVKSLGLMYRPIAEGTRLAGVEIDGPVSILEGTRRYGARFSRLLKTLVSNAGWTIEATISDEERRGGNDYTLSVDSSVGHYFPEIRKETGLPFLFPAWATDLDPKPVVIGTRVYFPDFSFVGDQGEVLVDISSPYYAEFNRERDLAIRKLGINWRTVYVISDDSKPVRGELNFYAPVNWDSVRKILAGKSQAASREPDKAPEQLSPEEDRRLRSFIEKEIMNPDKVVDFIEGEGYNPSRILPALGYRIRWNGLSVEISRKRG